MPVNINKPLWICPKCKQKFVSKNLAHSCTQFTVDEFFRGNNPGLRSLYRKFVKFVRQCGPIYININKTRISFQAKIRFCGVSRVLTDSMLAGFLMDREIDNERITKIEFIPPVYYVHYVKLKAEKDLDKELLGWIKESYKMGMREHLVQEKRKILPKGRGSEM
jgi:hypothetical protein